MILQFSGKRTGRWCPALVQLHFIFILLDVKVPWVFPWNKKGKLKKNQEKNILLLSQGCGIAQKQVSGFRTSYRESSVCTYLLHQKSHYYHMHSVSHCKPAQKRIQTDGMSNCFWVIMEPATSRQTCVLSKSQQPAGMELQPPMCNVVWRTKPSQFTKKCTHCFSYKTLLKIRVQSRPLHL